MPAGKILRSEIPDVEIPSDVSLSEFVFKHIEQFGDKVAMVCIHHYYVVIYICMYIHMHVHAYIYKKILYLMILQIKQYMKNTY